MNSLGGSLVVERDVPERVRAVLARVASGRFGGRFADDFANTVAVLYYAFASWGRSPHVPLGTMAYSGHRKTGRIGILYTIAAASMIEIFVVDLVVRQHHHVVANVLLLAGAFSAVWVVGFARAIQLRPILVDDTTLSIRVGVQPAIDIPRSNIASVELSRARISADKTTPGYVQLVTQPSVMIVLHAAQIVRVPFGTTRSARRIAFAVDDVKKFAAQIND